MEVIGEWHTVGIDYNINFIDLDIYSYGDQQGNIL